MWNKKLYSIKDFCRKQGYEPYQFFTELKRHPDYAANLTKDKNGDYVIDRDGLMIVDDVFQCMKHERRVRAAKRYNIEAVASEMNLMIAENKKLRERLKSLAAENKKLRAKLNYRERKK